MNHLSIPYDSIKNKIPDIFKEGFRLIGNWAGRIIKIFHDLSHKIHNDQQTAFAVFAIANAIFLTFGHLSANYLERRVISSSKKAGSDEDNFNQFLINGVVLGGSLLTGNIILTRALQYPLHPLILLATSTGAVALRFLLTTQWRKTDKPREAEIAEEKKRAEEAEKAKQEAIKLEQKQFIEKFGNEIREQLSKEFSYVNFSLEQIKAREDFLTRMIQGTAIIQDQPDICRAVCVSIQAAFERVLINKLKSGDIRKVDVLFLTGLPCTPFRTPLKEVDASKEAEWKKWTVDIRTQTVRQLREVGATVGIAYTEADYKALEAKSEIEFKTYAVEKEKPRMEDVPLRHPVPKELIGAVYCFVDKAGNRYQMATQGLQIQQHGEAPKECWKKWFSVCDSHPEADARIQEVFSFVNKSQDKIRFALEK